VSDRVASGVACTPSFDTTVRGLSTEVPVGPANGLDADGVISCDNIVTVPASLLGPQIGVLLLDQEDALTTAIHAAFDLD